MKESMKLTTQHLIIFFCRIYFKNRCQYKIFLEDRIEKFKFLNFIH